MPETFLHSGRVIWGDGSPVDGALVAVASGTAATPEIAIRTNFEGRFRVALPAGRFKIEARAPDGSTGAVDILVEGGEQSFEIAVDGRSR